MFHVVLVHLGFCNKIPQTEWLEQHLLLTALEAGKTKIKALADSGSGEGLFLVHKWPSFWRVLVC